MRKILIIDDEERIRDMYCNVLEQEGYSVYQAPCAMDANEILKKEKLDLILLDIRMPRVEGDELYEVIRLFHHKAKVIVSSVFCLEEQKQKIKGAVDYYDKSDGIETLLRKIRGVLKDEKYKESYCCG